MCGGFELLTMKEKSRTALTVVSYGSCTTEEIRCFGTGHIYIRPIQIDIVLADDADAWGSNTKTVSCAKCLSRCQKCDGIWRFVGYVMTVVKCENCYISSSYLANGAGQTVDRCHIKRSLL